MDVRSFLPRIGVRSFLLKLGSKMDVDADADQLPAPHEDQSPATHATAESTALHGGAPPTVPFQRLSKAEKRARKAEKKTAKGRGGALRAAVSLTSSS